MSLANETLCATHGSGNQIRNTNLASRRLSRVSRLRDMFQTGMVRPIEEIEDNLDGCTCQNAERFLRTLPGSPPLKALRNHHANLKSVELLQSNGLPTKPASTSSSSPDPSHNRIPPPARPPKPRHLILSTQSSFHTKQLNSAVQESPNTTPCSTVAISSSSHPLTDNFTSINGNAESSSLKKTTDSNVAVAVNQRTCLQENGTQCNLRSELPAHTPTQLLHGAITNSTPTTITDKINNDRHGCDLIHSPPKSNGATDENSTTYSDRNYLTSWLRHTTEPNQIQIKPEDDKVSISDFQDFILQPDAFHISPIKSSGVNIEASASLPCIQHSEPVAVLDTPDSEDKIDTNKLVVKNNGTQETEVLMDTSEDNEMLKTLNSLPIPRNLNVVYVDPDGVHVLEDGHFFYTLPGLSTNTVSDSETEEEDEEEDFQNEDPCHNKNLLNHLHSHETLDNLYDSAVAAQHRFDYSKSSSNNLKTPLVNELNDTIEGDVIHDRSILLSTSKDGLIKQSRVRFSSEPILVFSTHSTSDYNRRNDDIDPLAASAEFELEKNLEDMELFEVDFQKGPNGLGISIVGSGLDTIGGDQKLSIFIKSLTPGGAAEADGRIQVYDQIVEVDGRSLVGVTQYFAAQALQNTQDLVHFVLARERDPANSRIAKILAEKNLEEPTSSVPDCAPSYERAKDSMINEDTPGKLHELIALATNTVKKAKDDWDREHFDVNDDVDDDNHNDIVCNNSLDGDILLDSSKNFNFNCSPGVNAEPHSEDPQFSPRSVLKGTATAASTRRLHEAIMNCIKQAARNANQLLLTGNSIPTDILDSLKNYYCQFKSSSAVTDLHYFIHWSLASELMHNRMQLNKTQSKLRTLEQRITAQEAAADEAIERLCLQCRHLELELKRAQNNLAMKPQNLIMSNKPSISDCNDFINNDDDFAASTITSNSEAQWDSNKSSLPPMATNSMTEPEPSTNNCDLPISDADHQVIRQELEQIQLNRTHLVNSGGLANRRPPSKVTISAPLSAIQSAQTQTLDQSTFSLSSTMVKPIKSETEQSSQSSSACIRPPRPLPLHSQQFHRSSQTNMISSRSSDRDIQQQGTSTLPYFKRLGYQLPGMSDVPRISTSLRHLSSHDSTSTAG